MDCQAHDARDHVEREQAAARRAQEEAAAGGGAAGVVAHGEWRRAALVHPLLAAVARIEGVDRTVAHEYRDHAVGHARWRHDLGGHLRRPLRLAGVVEGEDLALVGADHDRVGVGAPARGDRLAGLHSPYLAAVGRIEAHERAVDGGRVIASSSTAGANPGTALPTLACHVTLALAEGLSSGSGPGFLLSHSQRSEKAGGTGR